MIPATDMTGYHMPTMRYCRQGEYIVRPRVPIWNRIRIIVAVVVITSVPWAWLVTTERELHRQELSAALAGHLQRPAKIVISWIGGDKTQVEINAREAQ